MGLGGLGGSAVRIFRRARRRPFWGGRTGHGTPRTGGARPWCTGVGSAERGEPSRVRPGGRGRCPRQARAILPLPVSGRDNGHVLDCFSLRSPMEIPSPQPPPKFRMHRPLPGRPVPPRARLPPTSCHHDPGSHLDRSTTSVHNFGLNLPGVNLRRHGPRPPHPPAARTAPGTGPSGGPSRSRCPPV